MKVDAVLAGVAVRDHDSATEWFGRFFGRSADARPMGGLAEWHFAAGYVQVVADADRGGRSMVTVQVRSLAPEIERLAAVGITPTEVDTVGSEFVQFATVHDPEGTAITLVQPQTP